MTNTIKVSNLYTFSNTGNDDGVLMTGNFFLGSSLSFAELTIDTLSFSVRYFGESNLSNYIYGTPVDYYRDSVLVGKFYLQSVTQVAANMWEYECISAIGLLDNTYHYGGIYKGELAGDIIDDVIGSRINYSVRQIFYRIKLYGWLPVGTRRENLQQILFACGGCVKKDESGNPYITILENTTPTQVAANRVSDGKITYDKKATQIDVTEHSYSKLETTAIETISEGELSGQNFTTPKGYVVRNAALVTFDKPYHSVTVEGTTILNDEVGVNYIIVQAAANAVIKGKPYIHAQNIICKDNQDVSANNGENVITVTDATLVSLANSSSVGARAMAYHGYANTVEQGIYLENEKTGDTIQFTNPWGKNVKGLIKELDGEIGPKVVYADAVIMSDYTPLTVQASHTLVSIAITTPPTRTVYEAGESFNAAGMVVTATYDDNETAIVETYNYSPSGALTTNDTAITITYTELGVTASATQEIEVAVVLKKIAVTTPPTKMVYAAGDTFNTTGMVVTAYYSDGTSAAVTDYTYSPTGALTNADSIITITYEEDGITKETYQLIAVDISLIPASISITQLPDKTTYKIGEYFDATGMVCQVIYTNYSINPNVIGYTFSPSGALGADDTTVTILYTYNGVTVSTSLNISMIKLASIEVTRQPSKIAYYEDEYFSPVGMIVTATYSDNSKQVISNYTYSPSGALVYGTNSITISYTEGNITKTANVAITVNYYNYDFTSSIVIDNNQTFTLSDIGATHKNIRVVCIGGGTGGKGGENGKAGTNGKSSSSSGGSSSSGAIGTGGDGGKGNEGGVGGKVFYQDLHIDSLNTPIAAIVGSGGAGSAGAVEPVAGDIGEHTSLTIGETTLSSENGNYTSSGFTDIFTSTIYALPGAAGVAGSDGGNGGESNGFAAGLVGEAGTDAGSNLGGKGGTGNYNTGGNIIQSWRENSGDITGYSMTIGTTRTGYKKKAFNTTSGTWSLTEYASIVVQKSGGNSTLYNMNGSSMVSSNWGGSSTVSGATTVPGYSRSYTRSANYGIAWGKGFGGGGGGGAAYNANGIDGELITAGDGTTSGVVGTGGAGASPSDKTTPSVYGCGGDGGNGGGGGGGGGGTFISTHTAATSTYSTGATPGGAGGIGGKGADGSQGCIIIYFS